MLAPAVRSKVLLATLSVVLGLVAACDSGGGSDADAAPGIDPDGGTAADAASGSADAASGSADAAPGIPPGYPALPPGVLQHVVGKVGTLAVDLTSPTGASDGHGSIVIDVSGNGVELAFQTVDLPFETVTGFAGFVDAAQVMWTDAKCSGDVPPPELDGLGHSGPYFFGAVNGYVCNDQGLLQAMNFIVSFEK
jgi:hypothetical protein